MCVCNFIFYSVCTLSQSLHCISHHFASHISNLEVFLLLPTAIYLQSTLWSNDGLLTHYLDTTSNYAGSNTTRILNKILWVIHNMGVEHFLILISLSHRLSSGSWIWRFNVSIGFSLSSFLASWSNHLMDKCETYKEYI